MYKEILLKSLGDKGYQDIRYLHMTNTSIKVKDRDIKEVSIINKAGGHSRVMSGGGWGTYSFNRVEDSSMAIRECLLASSLIPGTKSLAKAPVVKDVVIVRPKMDPRKVSIEEKKELLQKYSNILMDYPGIATIEGEYYEQFSNKYFINNEGSIIEKEEMICGITFRITSKGGSLTQQTRLSFGGNDNYEGLLNQEAAVEAKAKQTVDLLSAKPIVGGNYNVILDNDVSGLFIHEAFGHLSESDNLLGSMALRKTMTLGTQFGGQILNVIDDPSLTGIPGSYIYDDEGVRGQRTYLIKGGVLSGRLHSRETAGELGEIPTGHARAKDYSFTPVVRMGNIYIDKGPNTMEEMISSLEDGLYLFGSAGGQTSGEMFTFAVQGGYEVKNGKLGGMVRDIVLTGNLFTTMKNIDMIGEKVEYSKVGGCGKAGQILSTSGKGSAPIRITNMGIGGK